jgi:chemotaxis protein histidine kinase CheA
MAEPKRAGLLRYLKEAFAFRWNLLVLGGASAAALLSGYFDVLMPLVAAAELTYLAGLSTLPRFQAAIDARARAEADGRLPGQPVPAQPVAAATRDRILEVLKSLTEDRRARFLRLRSRCVEMTRIANAVRGETGDASGASAELRQPALDRLLWVFLKLLLSDQAIARFLQAADEPQILHSILDLQDRIQKREASLPEAERADDRILRSLHDSLSTAELRKDNIAKSKGNAEFVAAELERLENKIQAVTEMAVSHSDPDEMSSRIDAIAEGISQTEQTIRDLQSITGMAAQDETPSILGADIAQPAGAVGPAWPAGSDADDTRRRVDQVRVIAQGRTGRRPPGT